MDGDGVSRMSNKKKHGTESNRNIKLRHKLHEIIFEAETLPGKIFDYALIVVIIFSIVLVMLESVASINDRWGRLFDILEWCVTILFTIEYCLRIWCVTNRWNYVKSFYGVVDLLSVLPTYLSLLIPSAHTLLIVRSLRLLRIFRLLKLSQYLQEAQTIMAALKATRRKIVVFLFALCVIVILLGSLMYVVEGPKNGFTSIPTSVYWAVVTMTTVGYGDLVPKTVLGQMISVVTMLLGYAIIIVPTGVFSVEVLRRQSVTQISTQTCENCLREGHAPDAAYCKYCGTKL